MLKRIVEWLIVLAALPAVIPVMLIVTLAVRALIGSPVLFRQARPGLHGRIFQMYKFRTMTEERDAEGRLLPDEVRLTSFGKLLRSTSLDELASIFNFMRGDMALVGPRPLLPEYLTRYSADQARRHEVRPGITGWAQVNGRNELDWDQRLAMDVWYVDNRTLLLDLRILVKTARKVMKREGISARGMATMSTFQGNDSASVN